VFSEARLTWIRRFRSNRKPFQISVHAITAQYHRHIRPPAWQRIEVIKPILDVKELAKILPRQPRLARLALLIVARKNGDSFVSPKEYAMMRTQPFSLKADHGPSVQLRTHFVDNSDSVPCLLGTK
jgi:hypothetical protein